MNPPHHEPGLAEALDRALADRVSAATVLDPEVADLVEVGDRLERSAAETTPSAEFRAAARQRLLVGMARSPGGARSRGVSVGDRVRAWAASFAAGLAALGFAGAATASASASALPGDPLYPVKQATETVALHLATTDAAREEILLHQADTRLDEAARLLEQGRAADVPATTARYDDTLGALAETTGSEAVEANLRTNEVRLSELLQAAPGPARPGLERALAATERRLTRSRPAKPATDVEVVETVTTSTLTPPPRQSVRPSDTDDHTPTELRAPRPADAGERGPGESHDTPAETHGPGVERRPEAPPAGVETGLPSDHVSSGESQGMTVSDSRAAPHANPQPAAAPPGRTPPQRTVVPRSQPGGRGRP
jgi:hypothetical protein